jgi:hypothetical protein
MTERNEPTLDDLAAIVTRMQASVGQVGTDSAVLGRVGAAGFPDRIAAAGGVGKPVDVVAVLDAPSGRTERRRVVLVGDELPPRRFDAATRGSLRDDINALLAFELPVVLHRWVFDQVMNAGLAGMELSASAVISVQRSLLLVRGNLMVRIGKVVSDPRAQMVSLREQTVLNPELEDLRGAVTLEPRLPRF